ncbi:hypothetical protein LPJ61_001364 [Coemansia biformis]|uniref:Uncharacterized protein n=1 Tax=Coemansia biformis TaxID=1286918 RepID=A0A9W8CZN2_9FUNG|nr:hypothetical protein LPJ61_001364 [Coemansia biformis]
MKVVLPFGDYSRVVSSKDNFGWLASYLDNILPAVANTSVEIIDNTADDESVHASHMRPLLQYILRARSSVSVSLSREHSINIADMFPRTDSLTTLMYITYYTFNNMEKLIVDGQNRVITYPSLSRLYLLGQVDEQKRYFPPLMHAAPFPALVELHINMDYPFCDDLPFRGNEHCLRKTHIVLDPSTIRRLASSGFLLNSKRRALRSVVLGHGGEAVSSHTESAVYEGFFCKIVPMLQHLTIIEGTAMSQALLTLVSNRKEPLGLRTLSMFIDMSLTQCISLVQSLPSLERLFCRPLTLDAEFAGMDIQDVARQLRARYRPLGRRLRRILFKNISSDPSWETCACMLILADLCPHLTKITFPDDGNHRAEAVFTKIAESSALAGLKQSIVPPLKITIDRTHEFPIIRVNREVHRDCPALAESGPARSSSYTAQTMDDVTGHNFASAGNM